MDHQARLEALVNEFGVERGAVPTLLASAARADDHISQARRTLAEALDPELTETVDILALGSMARGEVTSGSDLDSLIVLHGLVPDHQAALDRVREVVDALPGVLQLRGHGGTGTFGAVIAASDLVHHVGLEADTNAQQTRRLLVLMESVSLLAPERHCELHRAVVSRYLDEYEVGRDKPPRFLINDVLRYWRTLTIDYQAKLWEADQSKWSRRHLKLISTRKLLVAGTIAAALTLSDEDPVGDLLTAMAEPSLSRLARLARTLENGQAVMETVIEAHERFLTALDDDEFGQVLRNLTDKRTAMQNDRFSDLVSTSRLLHDALVAIIHKSDPERSMKYLML